MAHLIKFLCSNCQGEDVDDFFNTSLIPTVPNAFDIGSAAFPIRNLYVGTDIVLNCFSTIRQNTANGADTCATTITGGGLADLTGARGGQILLGGNEFAAIPAFAGSVLITTGNNANNVIDLQGLSATTNIRMRGPGGNLWFFSMNGTLNQDGVNGSDIIFNKGDSVVRTGSVDGTDNLRLGFAGAAAGATRGGFIWLAGNEHASMPGYVDINSGNLATSRIVFHINNVAAQIQVNNAADTGVFAILETGQIKNLNTANEVVGAGSALLAANCPAVTVAAPFTWWRIQTRDGSNVFIPVWK